ncbi:amidophosphoribosyltransferase [Porphyromonadaceae bacterium]
MGGFFGSIQKGECATDLFYGIDYNSHMGTRRGGMVTLHGKDFARSIHNLENSYFRTKFENGLHKYRGHSGIGVISDTDPQPIVLNSHLGRFSIVTVAKINNLDQLEAELLQDGKHFSELSSGKTNQTELIALLITQGKTFVDGIENVMNRIKGSCSMLLLTETGIYCARDKYGRTPIIIGKKEEGFAASSESCSFTNLGYEIHSFVGPGEVVRITADECVSLRAPEKKMQVCSFLYVYYGYPVCDYEGINVEQVRRNLGIAMGKRDSTEVEFAAGIPDSGIGMALGYAEGKKIPYRRAIVKYTPTWPRSFTPANQNVRELVAKMKLIPNKQLLRGSKIVFCDDSIVRGTQLRDNVNILYGYGAKEVHMRISCPPLLHACEYINFSASKSILELITRRTIQELEGDMNKNIEAYQTAGTPEYNKMVDLIRERLNITTLKFNSMEDFVKAIGIPKEHLCTHCFDGSSYGG